MMSAKQLNETVSSQSGLLEISENSPDMRNSLEREAQDVRAAEAVVVSCCHLKRWVGAFAAALGGLDLLVAEPSACGPSGRVCRMHDA
jgi:acetate kinase